MKCYYCNQIVATDPTYAPRPAEFDTGSEAPRCAWHWRFVFDHCGSPGHFMTRFFCPRSGRLLCREAGRVEGQIGVRPDSPLADRERLRAAPPAFL